MVSRKREQRRTGKTLALYGILIVLVIVLAFLILTPQNFLPAFTGQSQGGAVNRNINFVIANAEKGSETINAIVVNYGEAAKVESFATYSDGSIEKSSMIADLPEDSVESISIPFVGNLENIVEFTMREVVTGKADLLKF